MKKSKGFTLAELLIVVAIIAVLVAVSIPVFTNQLEKAREATDEANIRSIYAQLSSDVLMENVVTDNTNCPTADVEYKVTKTDDLYTGTAKYTMTQQKDGTANDQSVTIGGVEITKDNFKKGVCTITVKSDGSSPTIVIGQS